MGPKYFKAFTLIELLIVVAIIAILAAIAVPNFLEAQTRAKVSRVKADLRTLATGIESYTVDYNKPPFDWAEDVSFPYYLHSGISTPVSYVSSGARLTDVFADNRQSSFFNPNDIRERFRYRAFGQEYLSGGVPGSPFSGLPGPSAPGNQKALDVHGAWFLVSKGPDASNAPLPQGFSDGNNEDDWLWLPYDPTNGTVSSGEVIRSQSVPDVGAVGYGEEVIYQ